LFLVSFVRFTREPTDEEVMYRVFAAEYLGAEGDLQSEVYALKVAFHDVLNRERALETLRGGRA